MELTPYLNFNRQCAEAFNHYVAVLGGTVESMTHGSAPAGPIDPAWKDKLLQAALAAPACS